MSQPLRQVNSGERSLTPGAPPRDSPIVLDTNVVLDWLLFNNPSSAHFAKAILKRDLRWVATLAMRDELAVVLGRGLAQARNADATAVLTAWDAHVSLVGAASALPAALGLQCSDPDDQKFLDLAHALGAGWLLSRDRAVLKLARQAARFSLTITVPEGWSAP